MTRARAIWLCKKAESEKDALSEWEKGFVDSILRKSVLESWAPSDKQAAVLEKIERKL